MSIKKNFIYNFLLTSSNLLFPLLTFPYVSRILGAEGLGICNFIFSYCQNFTIVAALGIAAYGIREVARLGNEKLKLSKLFFELLTLHLTFTCIVLIIYTVSIFFNADFQNYKQLTLMGGMIILFNAFNIEWLFTGVSDFKYITIRTLIIRALSVLSIYIFVKQKEDFNIYFAVTVITLLITVIINLNYAHKYISRNIKFSIKNVLIHIKPISLLGIYIVLTNIYSVLPTTLLGFLSSKVAVGYYYGANKIITMTISIFTALSIVMIPRLNLIIETKGREEYLSLINKALNVIISLGIPIAMLVYLLSDPLVMLLAGKEFINSIICVQIMAPVILIVAFAQVFVQMILFVNRKDKKMMIIAIAGLLINLFINVIFIPLYAERATSIARLVSELSVVLLSFYLLKRFINLQLPIKLILLNILFVIPFIFITYLSLKLSDNVFLQLLYSTVTCGSYFFLYQFFILKDKLLIETFVPYFNKLKKSIFRRNCRISK